MRVEYESETVLPIEIENLLEGHKKNLLDICYERDKLDCYISSLRHQLIVWFANHLKDSE